VTMSDHVHVFLYDDAPLRGVDSETVGAAAVAGTLFDVHGVGPALILSGQNRVLGSIRRIRADALWQMDRAARVAERLYRRVGLDVGNVPCWIWVAGPELAQRLATARRRGTGST
jgi:hypothetical protein